MSEAPSPDRPAIEIVRRDLQELRTKARASGVLSSNNGETPATRGRKTPAVFPDMEIEETGEKGKRTATKLLAMFRRTDGDTSPVIRGSDFTEKGVGRVLGLLNAPRERDGKPQKILERLHKFLTGPVPDGTETIAGVSLQKVRRVSRILQQIEKHGWDHVRAHMAKRKVAGGPVKPAAAKAPKRAVTAAPDKPRQKRRARS